MNVILNPIQSDTKRDAVTFTANSNLTGLEGYLWKIVNIAGVTGFDLPSNVADQAYFIGASGDVQGNAVAGESPGLNENCRIAFSGACNPGDMLSLNPNAWGQLYKPAAGAGAIYYDWVAEEAGVGATTAVPQFIKVRRIGTRSATL